MKLIITRSTGRNNTKPNVEKLSTTSAQFATVVFNINENDIPIVVFTDTGESFLINKLYDKTERSESTLEYEIKVDDLILINAPSAPSGVQSVTGLGVNNTDPDNPVIQDQRAYKVFKARILQTGTNAPTALSILENTTGLTFSFVRDAVGIYRAIPSGPLPGTLISTFVHQDSRTDGTNIITLSGSDGNPLYFSSSIGATPSDGRYGGATLEIQIYP